MTGSPPTPASFTDAIPHAVEEGAPYFLHDAEEYRTTLFSLLRAAREEILLEFYIFEADTFGERLLQELLDAAGRGVKVRMIVDGFGSRFWLQAKVAELRKLPLEVRIYHPLPWSVLSLRHALRVPRDVLYHLGTFNRRDHRKLVIVDGRYGMLGSHNIWSASLQWHEASLLLTRGCAALRDSFERVWGRTCDLDGKRWQLRKRRAAKAQGTVLGTDCGEVLDNTTLRRSWLRNKTILALIASAEQRLWITTPYLFPHRAMLRQIKARAAAGVDVKLILPRRSDVRFSHWMAQGLYEELLQSGVALHEFTGDILHAKVMVADDRFLLGSSNLNHRSFVQDLEIDYLGIEPQTLEQIVQWKRDTLEKSERVGTVDQVSLYRLKYCLARLMNPWRVFF
ncbi:MAG TPA: phosphatidylserine/phosphatidylglycerophosphate/cardiolipin synthase family protein [Hyphomicrobiales bacterium]|nr:phosphatidylserine/phosphatidylglycerophosphate/cardiolipin synthase family protein [Hyphomicrobiales bacterium]